MNTDYKDTIIIFDNFSIDFYKNSYFIIDHNVDKFYNFSQKIHKNNYFLIKSGEKTKSFIGVKKILDFFIDKEISLSSEVVAIGGGSLLDLVGFAASIYKRGVPLHFVPTTLLSMADAAIGGKNGINYKKIKNLIGTFKFPKSIWIDSNFTRTLPKKHLVSGYIEILKMSMLDSWDFFNFLISNSFKSLLNNNLDKIIQKSVRIKEKFIQNDLYDQRERKLLNFGHTIGHSIELEYNIPHGIAVAFGIMYALKLSEFYKSLNPNITDIYVNHLKKIKSFFSKEIDINKVINKMKYDKKIKQNSLDLILLEDIGKPVIFNIKYDRFLNDFQNLFKS